MKLTVEEYLEQLNSNHLQQESSKTDAASIQQAATAGPAVQKVLDTLASGYLAKQTWTVQVPVGEPVQVCLETNLINVPMEDAERLDPKLLDNEQAYPVNIYMTMAGEGLNKSDFRIDELLAGETSDAATGEILQKFQQWCADQLGQLAENRQAAKD